MPISRALMAVVLLPNIAFAQQGVNRYGNPPKLNPSPTAAAITARDLQIRLYQFADDSMMGRQTGRVGNMQARFSLLLLEPSRSFFSETNRC